MENSHVENLAAPSWECFRRVLERGVVLGEDVAQANLEIGLDLPADPVGLEGKGLDREEYAHGLGF